MVSGDTTFNENLISHAQGVDLLVHEVTHGSGDGFEQANLDRIRRNHTVPEDAAVVFSRTRPKLAVYNHILLFGDAVSGDLIPATRPSYDGPLVVGADLMQFELGEDVQINQFSPGPETG